MNIMTSRAWFRSILTWDGALPVIAAITPIFLPQLLPSRDLAELIAVIGVPMLTALIRAHHGRRQLENISGETGLGCQFLFGMAILTLLPFEGLIAVLHFDLKMPSSAWLVAAGLYLSYLALIALATRPRSSQPLELNPGVDFNDDL